MSRTNSNFGSIKEDNKSLQAALSLLRQDFDAHNHDGTSSKTFQTLLAETLSARTLSIRKVSYADNTAGLYSGVVGGIAKFFLGNATDNFKFNGTSLNIALASGGINIDGGTLTITQSIGNLLLNSSGMIFKVTTYDNANIILSSGSGPVGNGVQLRFVVGGSSGGNGAQLDFTYTAANTGNFGPSSGKSIDLGTASSYFNEINYKTLTDRGCLGWFDEGVEMQDGTILSDVEALKAIKKSDTEMSVHGVPMLDYATMPKVMYRPAPIAEEDIYENFDGDKKIGKLLFKKGDKMGHDGAETTSLISIMLGAIKELSTKVDALEKKDVIIKP